MLTSTVSDRVYDWQRPLCPPHPKTSYGIKHGVRVNLPASVDLRPNDSPVQNQGSLGSCTGNGWAGFLDYRAKNKPAPQPAPTPPTPSPAPVASTSLIAEVFLAITGYLFNLASAIAGRPRPKPTPQPIPVPPKPPTPTPATPTTFSRLFIYWNERNLEGTTGSDSGASVQDGGKVVSTLGAPLETTWPYDINQFRSKPPQSAFDEASKHVQPAPSSVDTTDLAEVKTALANGCPIVFGFDVYASFESLGGDSTYHPAGGYMGGHCVMAVGYDDARQAIIVRNSWGTEWGDGGYFYFPYTYFIGRMVSDAWTISVAA